MSVSTRWHRPRTVSRKQILLTGPVPYPWLFLQGLAWYLKTYVFVMLAEREVTEKKNGKEWDFLIFPVITCDGSKGQLPWTRKMDTSGLNTDEVVWSLLCPPPTPSQLPKPATTPRLSSGMTPPSIFNVPTKAETWAVAQISPSTSPSHPVKSCWFYLKRASSLRYFK